MVHFQVTRARNWVRGRGVVRGGRHPHRDRLPVPLRGDRDQGRRHHHQPARYGRLRHARGILPDVPHGDGEGAGLGEGDLLRALPQRPRHGGGQLAGRRPRRLPADRMHHQRHRRAGRQRRARRGGDGDQDARRRAALRGRHRRHHAQPRLQAGGGGHLVPGAVQQGHRRPQRLRARERHPPGRHAQAHADLRDHDAGVGRRVQDLAGDGQALGPQRLPHQAQGAGLRAGRERAGGRLQPLQGAGRPQEARLRRGPRGAGRRGDRHRAGPHEGGGADR